MPRRDDPALRELVNAVIWPGFLGRRVPDWLRRELDAGLAGAVLFAQNLGDRAERRALAAALHAGRDDVLVGIDEEGGNVTRLEARSGSTLPGAWQLGFIDEAAATEAVGRELARRSLAVGANVVLGPVADVNVDPANPVIGVRSFGDEPELVSRHVAATVRGIQSAGAAACVKHFPGHGDTHVDSHHALPELRMPLAELERVHLPPFEAAIAAGVRAVMTGHLVLPEWGELPATLNPVALGRLRALGFEGAIVTDALDMAAVRATVGAGRGAVLAVQAGADLLCIGNPANPGAHAAPDQDALDFAEVQSALLDAIASGELEVSVLERAAARVRALAAGTGSGGTGAGTDVDARRTAASGSGSAAAAPDDVDAASLVRRAISVHGDLPEVSGAAVVLDVRRRPTLAVDSGADYVAAALSGGGTVRRIEPEEGEAGEVAAAVAAGGPVVVLADAFETSPGQRSVVDAVRDAAVPAVLVHVGVPLAEPPALPLVETRAASRVAAEAAGAVLRGTF
ncbi:glycoside hydrolase family 3 N-terminal domain-containing protein [Agromyces sp. G08B096]|uniref:Glycoside hydrolase family 3 N-terminal domain-containing protein n=1 Tax=Agromyces sp. G08B096 TaxID=3156399 RepID=A0AAU7WAF9_9MICO